MKIFNTEPKSWQELQYYVGQLFTECGFETEISKVVDLVRGKKEIDVYTQDVFSEYRPIILVECKFWNKPISQETIHSFRTVIADFGANLGFIVSKKGFQKGSYKAAEKTNIRLVSLEELEAEYYVKWKQSMARKYSPISDRLFPYWDYPGKQPNDGGTIDWEKQQLVHAAYRPICSIGLSDFTEEGFKRNYPIKVPVINNDLIVIDERIIKNNREYFDFVEENKDKALNHFKILYRE